MKKILVPTDFSMEASYALEVANEVVKHHNFAQIILLHVIEPPSSATFVTSGETISDNRSDIYFVKLMDRVKQNLEEIIKEESNKRLNIIPKVKIGNTYKSIAEEIATEGVDLIIMGSKGSTGLEELLLGSNAEKVVRLAACPVITVKKRPRNFKIRDIVFASDFKEEIDSFEKIKELQEMFFAKLHLLFVNTPARFEESSAVTARMDAFIEKYALDNCSVNIINARSEESGITEFGEKINADVVALATHNRKGIIRLLMGSITEDIVNHSKAILYTFPIKEKA